MEEPKKKTSPEVTEFANLLQRWAAEGTDQERKQRLLRWLLSRCESHGLRGTKEGKYVIKGVDVSNISMVETVERAMAGYNPDLPTSDLVQSSQIWSKAYSDIWPKAYSDIWPKAYGDIWPKAYGP